MVITDKCKQAILDCFTFDKAGNLLKTKSVSKYDSGCLGRASERVRKSGYKDVKVLGKRFLSHRVVWLLHTGDWPKAELDHINFDHSDNRIENLREADRKQNTQRTSREPFGKSSYLGVTVDKCGFFVARVGKKYLGYFRDEKSAALAYNKAALETYGEFAKVNKTEEPQEK
jgi:hypothetical protein